MRTCLAILPALFAIARADQVLWSYPLTELPPGWTVTEGVWSFEADGAHSDAYVEAFQIDWNVLFSDTLVLPPGTDSISISASQYSVTWETDATSTFSFNRMVLLINGVGGIYWNVSGNVTSSDPIFVVPLAAAGDTVVVQLVCGASSYPDPPLPPPGQPQATADLHIWDFVVTAYGNLGLDQATWGAIKQEGSDL